MRLARLLGLVVLGFDCELAPLAAQQPSQSLTPANHSDISLAFRFGTLGLGLEASKLLASHFGVRLGGYFFSYSLTHTQSNIDYSATLKLHDFSGLVDLYPWGRGSFHLSTGIVTSPLAISATGQPTGGTYRINHVTYTASQVGTLTADASYKSGPYAGFGFGTPATMGGALKFLFDLGAVFAKPTVSLSATGAASNPSLASDLQAQQQKTQHDLNKLKLYPVLSFGLAYRF